MRRVRRLGRVDLIAVASMTAAALLCTSSCRGISNQDVAPPPIAAPIAVPYVVPPRPLCAGGYAGLPTVLGRLGDGALVELSGVVPSPSATDLLWAHNDSGHQSLLFALRADGSSRGRLRLPFDASDLEDIAVASCPDRRGPCLYLADTGNNAGDRYDQAIYIVAEPALPEDGRFADTATVTRALRIDASPRAGLPPGLDLEALAVLPDASALLLIEKADVDRARVFALRGPFATRDVIADIADADTDTVPAAGSAQFVEVGTLRTESPAGVARARMITGADVHPSGRALAIRTYSGIFEVRLADGETFVELGERTASTVTFGPLSEPQGEAIAYDVSGTGLLTISEARDRPASEVPVNVLGCR